MNNWIIQGTVKVGDQIMWQETFNKASFVTEEACKAFINGTDAVWQSAQRYVMHLAEMFDGVISYICITNPSI